MLTRRRKLWTSLTAAATTLPVAMGLPLDAKLFGEASPTDGDHAAALWLGVTPAMAQSGGEGGEGGEAGASVAADDPAALAVSLDALAAYAQAGLAASAAGQKETAAELLKETEETFEKEVAPALKDPLRHEIHEALEKAADLARDGAAPADIESAGKTALAEIAEAGEAVSGDGKVQAKAFLESLNRAALELSAAAKDPADVAAYFEAYGYLKTAEAREAMALAALDGISADAGAKARAALDAVAKAAPSATPPVTPAVPPGEVLAAVSAAMLAGGL